MISRRAISLPSLLFYLLTFTCLLAALHVLLKHALSDSESAGDMRVSTSIAIGALATAASAQNSTSYAVKTPPLDTPWTYQVGTNPWPEYPRPQLQRSEWKSLNGIWTYANASSSDAINSPPFGQTLGQEILIPSCVESGLSGEPDQKPV